MNGTAGLQVSLVLAGLATPLVLSVHTIVSMDFATSVIPGWHTTIFPPYFVAGAIFSGFAMVQTLLLIVRKIFKMEDYINIQHIEMMNKERKDIEEKKEQEKKEEGEDNV